MSTLYVVLHFLISFNKGPCWTKSYAGKMGYDTMRQLPAPSGHHRPVQPETGSGKRHRPRRLPRRDHVP